MSDQVIKMKVVGDKKVMQELTKAAHKALPVSVIKRVYLQAMKPMLKTAKQNARNIPKDPNAKKTKSGKVKLRNRNRLGAHMAKALKVKRFKSRRKGGVNLSVIQSDLPKSSKTTGRSFEYGLGHMMEVGSRSKHQKRPRGRGGIKGGNPIWRAYQTWENHTLKTAEKKLLIEFAKKINTNFTKLRFKK